MASIPKPSYQLKCYPQRKEGELDTDYQKRILQFMEEENYPQQQIDDWKKNKCLTFILPRDEEAFKKFMQDNPSAKLTMNCSSRDDLREGMSALRAINPDFIKNLTEVTFANDPKGGLKGPALEKEKAKIFPHLRGPRPGDI